MEAWRARVRSRLASRFGLRLHMAVLMAAVFAVAFVTTRLLLALGVGSMGIRYLVASLTGYAAFFGLVRAYLWWVTTEAERDFDPDRAPDSVAFAVEERPPGEGPGPAAARARRSAELDDVLPDVGGSGGRSGGSSFDVDGDGCVAILIVAIVALVAAVVFGAAGYLVYQAPAVLGEAAFELVLASVLARSSRRVSRGDWSGSVLGATWKLALGMLVVTTAGGVAAQRLCPGPETLGGVVRQCVLGEPPAKKR